MFIIHKYVCIYCVMDRSTGTIGEMHLLIVFYSPTRCNNIMLVLQSCEMLCLKVFCITCNSII